MLKHTTSNYFNSDHKIKRRNEKVRIVHIAEFLQCFLLAGKQVLMPQKLLKFFLDKNSTTWQFPSEIFNNGGDST